MIQLKPGLHPSSLAAKPRAGRKGRAAKKKSSGLRFEKVFSDAACAPFDQIEWEKRTAEITDDSGKGIHRCSQL